MIERLVSRYLDRKGLQGVGNIMKGLMLIACLFGVGMGYAVRPQLAQAQSITGQFQPGIVQPTLILINDSTRMPDYQVQNVSAALTGLHGVSIAARGSGQCYQGDWCLSVTDALLERVSTPEAMGARVADALLTEIVGLRPGR